MKNKKHKHKIALDVTNYNMDYIVKQLENKFVDQFHLLKYIIPSYNNKVISDATTFSSYNNRTPYRDNSIPDWALLTKHISTTQLLPKLFGDEVEYISVNILTELIDKHYSINTIYFGKIYSDIIKTLLNKFLKEFKKFETDKIININDVSYSINEYYNTICYLTRSYNSINGLTHDRKVNITENTDNIRQKIINKYSILYNTTVVNRSIPILCSGKDFIHIFYYWGVIDSDIDLLVKTDYIQDEELHMTYSNVLASPFTNNTYNNNINARMHSPNDITRLNNYISDNDIKI